MKSKKAKNVAHPSSDKTITRYRITPNGTDWFYVVAKISEKKKIVQTTNTSSRKAVKLFFETLGLSPVPIPDEFNVFPGGLKELKAKEKDLPF